MISCGVYVPKSIDIPLINKKNDLRIDGGLAPGTTGVNITSTISYGLTKFLAIQAYGSIGEKNVYLYQGALGYYKKLNNKKVMEIYMGLGKGYGYQPGSAYLGTTILEANYQTYFTQFNFGILDLGKRARWDIGFAAKSGIITANWISTDLYQLPTDPSTNYNENFYLFEPSLFYRVGGEHLKARIRIGGIFTKNLANGPELPSYPIEIGIGLNYRF